MRWIALFAFVVLVLGSTASAAGQAEPAFPRVRAGVGNEPTAGGGFVAGDRYVTRTAVVAWDRHWGTLTLFLLSRASVNCQTLRTAAHKPGHLIQVYVTSKPKVTVGRRMSNPQVAFLTVDRNPDVPTHVAGLKSGAQLTFTRVDSYPGGVWHGIFKVPHNVYGDGMLYGYSGTFAARWCQLRR